MALKQALSQIAIDKANRKKQQQKLKNLYIATIYKGLVKRKTIREIHKELYDKTINKKSPMLFKAMVLTNRVSKKMKNRKLDDAKLLIGSKYVIDPVVLFSVLVFDEIKRNDVDVELNKEITKENDNKESNSKLEALESAMSSGNVFYLASSHNDSAKDHEPYQGKMYYNENWMSELDSDIAKQEVANYITQHKLKSVQWVTGKPVYFITRPNCRHYMKEIPVREALTISVDDLIKRYGLHTKIGKRTFTQTLKTDKKRKVIGEIRNAELVIEKYKERLQLFKAMYKEQPNPVIRNAINKTQLLIEKWSLALEKLKGGK